MGTSSVVIHPSLSNSTIYLPFSPGSYYTKWWFSLNIDQKESPQRHIHLRPFVCLGITLFRVNIQGWLEDTTLKFPSEILLPFHIFLRIGQLLIEIDWL
jgi:hypothetical protein